jgi:hypothetical protein
VCEGDSLSECSRKLGAIVDARGTKDKYATMTGGAMPTFRPATNARERAGGTGVEAWEYAFPLQAIATRLATSAAQHRDRVMLRPPCPSVGTMAIDTSVD